MASNKNNVILVVVTGRDYRANLAKYYGLAQKGEELRGALREAKEAMQGKRKLNTLDNLINELRNSDQ